MALGGLQKLRWRAQGGSVLPQLLRTYHQSSAGSRYAPKALWGTPARHQPTPSTVTRAKLTPENSGTRAHKASSELRAALPINKSSGK